MVDYPSDWTPLHIAVWRLNSLDEVRSLANRHSVNVQDDQGWTPVHLACARSGSLLMSSHQSSSRGWRFGQLPYRSKDRDKERRESFATLRVLLEQRPILTVKAKGFCTPLHCAANSGWYSHSNALIRAGAPVYTGPECSPLCWAAGGSGGNYAVAILLRGELGEHGLSMIKADHERRTRGTVQETQGRPLSEYRQYVPGTISDEELELQQALMNSVSDTQTSATPVSNGLALHVGWSPSVPRPLLHGSPNKYGLCTTCSRISFEEMEKRPGYMHVPSIEDLKSSAVRCKLCRLMLRLLGDGLEHLAVSQIIVGVSNGNHSRCSEPNRLRTLDFKVSEGCTCNTHINIETSEPNPYFTDCKGICKFEREASVTIFTDEVNDERVQVGIEISEDPLSSITKAIIQDWHTTCNEEHENCKDRTVSGHKIEAPLPSRVIEVGQNKVRLVSGANKRGKYLALSHRWITGKMPDWVTKEANKSFESRFEWFAIEDLPATIKDAVRVTRELGFQYVWIDSICIIQDSPSDWAYEASMMSEVYANAFMTLFADCAVDDNAGFLYPRVNTLPSMSLPIKTTDLERPLWIHIRQTTWNSFDFVQKSLFDKNVESAHLSDRAWIFQERILSKRILHFGHDQIFWECDSATIAEDGHIIDQDECGTNDLRFSKQAYSAVIKGLLPSEANKYKLLPCIRRVNRGRPRWQDVVKAYSRLNLTYGDDKLVALSGLASTYAQIPKSQTNQYIAGMWRNELIIMLSWRVSPPSSVLPSVPSPKRIPSFSWTGVDCPITFEADGIYGDIETIAQIVGADIEYATANIYGNIRSCRLTLKAPVTRAITLGPLAKALGSLEGGMNPLYNEGMLAVGRVHADHQESLSKSQDVICLQILKAGSDYSKKSLFLVLTPASEGNTGCKLYRRVGIGSTEVSREAEAYVEGCMFRDAPIETIEII